jgi:glycosyltransferase involved in cell wall biosynthesis
LFVIGNTGRINVHSIKFIFQLIKKHSIDIVHSHEAAALLYGFPAAKLGNIPIIHTKHGYGNIHQNSKIIEWLVRWFSRSVSEYICVSRELKRRMETELGVNNKRISVIYNGTETFPEIGKGYVTDNREIIIGSVGRLEKVKNYNLLISAFNEIQKKHPNCRLEIVGGGECETELRNLIEQMLLSDKVKLHGYQLDVNKYLDRFDIYALTSIYEGLSISLLEAFSKGKPCVVSDVGGNTEIIEDGKNGFVFKSGNKNQLISKLSSAINGLDSQWMKAIRRNALETFKAKFTIQTMVEKHEELYKSVLKKHGRLK